MKMENQSWFNTRQVGDNLYLTTEDQYFAGNRSNIWLIKGPSKDVIIDCGLGVCDLRRHLDKIGLISAPDVQGHVVSSQLAQRDAREVKVICTHVHFDHSGGAHHFDDVSIHDEDRPGLVNGRQTDTLNYAKSGHFYSQPTPDFNVCSYKVPPTPCTGLTHGDRIDIGGGEHLEILHVPGHTKGSICIYYPAKGALFSGDFVYDCGFGGALLDWLPTSNIRDYCRSADVMCDWLGEHDDVKIVYPGHFQTTTSQRVISLLQEYIESKDHACSRGCGSCLQASTWAFFLLGCFRCCPCG